MKFLIVLGAIGLFGVSVVCMAIYAHRKDKQDLIDMVNKTRNDQ
ncbi:hypothetical protein [Vibrio furnissii]|nr:hypothetical protein [Vibrio furnissii]